MSNDNQSDITGKKIFFMYPTASVQNLIITELVQQEYEVYVCRNHNRLARALKKYYDSVLYINIDDGMSVDEWEKWIRTLKTALPELNIGIFSSSSDEKVQELFIKGLQVTCGFIQVKIGMSKTIEQIIEKLEKYNVKGRRKYIRATTERDSTATVNMPFNGEFINGSVKDISVVGVSCAFDHDPGLKKNSLNKDIQLKLKSMILKIEAVVFGSRPDGGQNVYVMLFTQRVDPDVKVKIRKYIQQNLQSKMDQEIN